MSASPDHTTLGRMCPERFPRVLATYLREMAETDRAARGRSATPMYARHAPALDQLADHALLAGVFDQRLCLIEACQEGRDKFTPGSEALKMLRQLAIGIAPGPDTYDALSELALCSVIDLRERTKATVADAKGAARRELRTLRAQYAPREDVDKLERELAETSERLTASQAALAEANKAVEFFREQQATAVPVAA